MSRSWRRSINKEVLVVNGRCSSLDLTGDVGPVELFDIIGPLSVVSVAVASALSAASSTFPFASSRLLFVSLVFLALLFFLGAAIFALLLVFFVLIICFGFGAACFVW